MNLKISDLTLLREQPFNFWVGGGGGGYAPFFYFAIKFYRKKIIDLQDTKKNQ